MSFAVLLYSKIVNRLPQETVYEIFREAVNIECAIVIKMYGHGLKSNLKTSELWTII